ncbi:hypothetical protein MSPGM_46430 [Methylorubrum sp. GM97]|nr:hypothetical protein MSPGM_46430 [Methylorubrum sp. GM97]
MRRVVLPVGLALGAGALGALTLTEAGIGLRVKAGPILSDLHDRFSGVTTPAANQPPTAPSPRPRESRWKAVRPSCG